MRSIRWTIALLITAAAAIAYLDRLALTPTWEAIRHTIRLSDNDFGTLQSLFFGAYALMYVGGGTLTDLLGTRRGFLLLVVCFSLACAGHGLAAGFFTLAAARLMLGLAQGGVFPAGSKAVAEWFPARERATAMGMFNGGSAIGLIAAAPAAALVLRHAPWPWVFYLSGAVGLLWAGWWLWDYYPPAQHPRLTAHERLEIAEVLTAAPRRRPDVSWRQRLLSWGRLLLLVEIWGIVLGKFFGDAVWFTHSMWLPKYLHDAHGLNTMQTGAAAWIPYAASGVGSVFGGWCSSRLMHCGYSLNFSRKAVLGASAALMPCMCLITHVPLRMEIVLYSVAFFAHLSFSTLVLTLATDMFPRGMVGTIVGLVGFGSSMGGVCLNKAAGLLLEHLGRGAGYPVLFAISGTLHVVGFLWILLTVRDVRPIARYAASGDEAEQAVAAGR